MASCPHERRVPEVDAGTDAGTNYDVPKHKLQRFNSLKVRVQWGRDKHPNGRPSNPDAEAIDFRLILLKLFVVVLVIVSLCPGRAGGAGSCASRRMSRPTLWIRFFICPHAALVSGAPRARVWMHDTPYA